MNTTIQVTSERKTKRRDLMRWRLSRASRLGYSVRRGWATPRQQARYEQLMASLQTDIMEDPVSTARTAYHTGAKEHCVVEPQASIATGYVWVRFPSGRRHYAALELLVFSDAASTHA